MKRPILVLHLLWHRLRAWLHSRNSPGLRRKAKGRAGQVRYKNRRKPDRACISLTALRTKASITLLRALLDAIERFGAPRAVRTDNEVCFTSRLFRFGLWLLGIRHQRIDLHCPWQNGRIERFFGTLKEKLNRIEIIDFTGLSQALIQFRCWYNHVRPHQHLGYRTPDEAWTNRQPGKWAIPCTAWEGLLTGYYHPPDH